jgi:WG containing repeat
VFNISAKEGSKCLGGLIIVKDKNNKYYLVNKTGKQVNAKTWDEIGDFSDGLALVKENSKWGFIDIQGNKVIDLKFDVASGFKNGAAIVKSNDRF